MLVESNDQFVLDEILLEDKYSFKALTKIYSRGKGVFTIKFDFVNLSPENFKHLVSLCQLNKALKFGSSVIKSYNADLTQFIVANFRIDENKNIQWECISK